MAIVVSVMTEAAGAPIYGPPIYVAPIYGPPIHGPPIYGPHIYGPPNYCQNPEKTRKINIMAREDPERP